MREEGVTADWVLKKVSWKSEFDFKFGWDQIKRPQAGLKEPAKYRYGQDFPGSLVVKTSTFNAGAVGSTPGWGANIPHALWKKKKQKTIKQNVVTNSIKAFKMVHIKRSKLKKKV